MLCRCSLGEIVFCTGRKRDAVCHWPCAGPRWRRLELCAFLMLNSGRLATRQTPTLHLIITSNILVTRFRTRLPSEKYRWRKVQSTRTAYTEARGQDCAVRHASLLHPHFLYTHPDDRRAGATSFQFIRFGTVAISSPTTAGVEFKRRYYHRKHMTLRYSHR